MFAAILVASAALCGAASAADYQPKGKRDPFVPLLLPDGRRINPPGAEDGSSEGLANRQLQGIVYDPSGDSFVILGGKVLRERQELGGMKILEIGSDSVTILRDGQTERLTVRKQTKETE